MVMEMVMVMESGDGLRPLLPVYIIHWTGGVQRATDPHMQNFACFGRKTNEWILLLIFAGSEQVVQECWKSEISSFCVLVFFLLSIFQCDHR